MNAMSFIARMAADCRKLGKKRRGRYATAQFAEHGMEPDWPALHAEVARQEAIAATRLHVCSRGDYGATHGFCLRRALTATLAEQGKHWLGHCSTPAQNRLWRLKWNREAAIKAAPHDAEQARRQALAAPWLTAKSRWRASAAALREAAACSLGQYGITCSSRAFYRALRARMRDCVAAELLRRGHELHSRSPSGTIYVFVGESCVRLADHHLGYADYGSREQSHDDGPDVVFCGHETESLAELADRIEEEAARYRQRA